MQCTQLSMSVNALFSPGPDAVERTPTHFVFLFFSLFPRVLSSMPAVAPTGESPSAFIRIPRSCPASPAPSLSSQVPCPRYLSCRRSHSSLCSSSRGPCFTAPDGALAAGLSSPSSPSTRCSCSARPVARDTRLNPSAASAPGSCPSALRPSSSATIIPVLYPVPPMSTLTSILCFLSGWQRWSSLATGPKTVFSPHGSMRSKDVILRGHYPFTLFRGIAVRIAWFLVYLSVLASVWLTSPSVRFSPFFPSSFFSHRTPLLSPWSVSTSPAEAASRVRLPRTDRFQRSTEHSGTVSACTLSIGPPTAHFFSTSVPADLNLEEPSPALSLQACPCEVFDQHSSRLQKGDLSQLCRYSSCLSGTRAHDRTTLPHGKEIPASTSPSRYLSSESQNEAEPTRPRSLEQPGKSGQIRRDSGGRPQNVFSLLSFAANPLIFAKALSLPGYSGYTSLPLSASLFPEFPRSYSLFRAFSARPHKQEQGPRHPAFPGSLLDLRGGCKKDQKDGTLERLPSAPLKLTTTPEDKFSCSPVPPHVSATAACERAVTCPDSTTSLSASPSFPCSSRHPIPEKNETAVNALKDCNDVSDLSQRDFDDTAVPSTYVGNGLQCLPIGRRRRTVRGSDLLQGENSEEMPVLRFVASRASSGAAARTTAPCGGGKRGTQPDEVEELELEDQDDVQVTCLFPVCVLVCPLRGAEVLCQRCCLDALGFRRRPASRGFTCPLRMGLFCSCSRMLSLSKGTRVWPPAQGY